MRRVAAKEQGPIRGPGDPWDLEPGRGWDLEAAWKVGGEVAERWDAAMGEPPAGERREVLIRREVRAQRSKPYEVHAASRPASLYAASALRR